MFNRECVILTIESQAILWYRGIVLYGSIGLPQAKFTNALTLGTICVRQSAYRSNDGAIPRYESCWPCWRRRGSLPALQATLPRHSHPKPAAPDTRERIPTTFAVWRITPSPGGIINIWKRHRLMPVRT